MKRLTQLFISGLLAMTFGLGLSLAPQAMAATPKAEVCQSINAGADCTTGKGVTLSSAISAIIKILSIVVGITAVIMIIIAGLKYVTSGGDSSGIASAKSTLIYAIVGLVVAATAQIIVRYVLFRTK